MAKAIIGSTVTPRTFELLEEIRALRNRVAELEEALAAAEEKLSARREQQLVELEDGDVEALNALA